MEDKVGAARRPRNEDGQSLMQPKWEDSVNSSINEALGGN